MSSSQGTFVWYDVMTTDSKAAETFYRDVVGWRTQDSGLSDRSYTILSVGETPIGGLMPLPAEARAAGAQPVWSGYVAVDDVDAMAAKVKGAGGSIHRAPEDIPGIGRFAYVADPHGAGFILFKGASSAQPQPPAPGTPATGRPPSRSTRSCSAGPRARPWIWARWASISCSRSAACPRAA